MRKNFVHEHPENSSSWEMPQVQAHSNDSKVYSIDCPTCRWSLRKRIAKQNRVHKNTNDIAYKIKKNAEALRGDCRWKRDKRFVHMTGKSETVSEYFAFFVVTMFKIIKCQMFSHGVIRIEKCTVQVQSRMKVTIPISLKASGESTARLLIWSCWLQDEKKARSTYWKWECSKLLMRKNATTTVAKLSCLNV